MLILCYYRMNIHFLLLMMSKQELIQMIFYCSHPWKFMNFLLCKKRESSILFSSAFFDGIQLLVDILVFYVISMIYVMCGCSLVIQGLCNNNTKLFVSLSLITDILQVSSFLYGNVNWRSQKIGPLSMLWLLIWWWCKKIYECIPSIAIPWS